MTLVASGAAYASDWRRDVPCGRELVAPHAATLDGCAAAHCAAVDVSVEVCACRPLEANDARDWSVRLTLREGGIERRRWAAETMLGDTDTFRVRHVDLDGDGRDEILVATLDAVSNGLGVHSWTLCIFAGRDRAAPPACTALVDYPILGMLTRVADAKGCRVLATDWRSGSEPKRGDGLYLVGRWLDYRDGTLSPTPGRPLVERRYLYRFEAERGAAFATEGARPLAWFRDATTRAVRCPDALCVPRDAW
ncbi:MAG: hypothetical protein AB1689_07040 [Thermodesulfobacteriota bacterium]